MNPDLKDLRVAVVPTETQNGINQRSTYEEIVACEETTYFSVPDYFKAQNDEELPLQHWSFLLDYNKKVDMTGANTDGIDYDSKAIKIDKIVAILTLWGGTSTCELELDHSPCKSSIGNGKTNISELIEIFNSDGVEAITYNDEIEIGWNTYQYDELEEYLIDEILEIMKVYEKEQDKLNRQMP